MAFLDRQTNKHWPRSQKFQLSSRGADAEARYREMIVAARAVSGRPAFDAARTEWAAAFAAVRPEDGAYLGELQSGPRTIGEMIKSLETSGSSSQEVKAAVDRLSDAAMIEPVPA